jgi:hypothetical protein
MDVIKVLPTYMTVWNVVLVVLAHKIHRHIDLLLTSFVVMSVSSYLLYVNPRYWRMITDWESGKGYISPLGSSVATLLHVAFHVLPLVYIASYYGVFYVREPIGLPILTALIFILMYPTIFNPYNVYALEFQEISTIAISSVLTYLSVKTILS